jgi:hypothetical protein
VDDLTLDVAAEDVVGAEDTTVDVGALDAAAEDVADVEDTAADVGELDVTAEDVADVVPGPKEVEIGVWLVLVIGSLVLGCVGASAR